MPINGISPFAVGGLASGLDTTGIIEKMMEAYQKQEDLLLSKRSTMERQKTVLRDFNMQLLRLQNRAFDLRLATPYEAKNMASSNSAVVTGTTGPGAVNGQHTIKVTQLAQAARVSSSILSPRISNNPPNTAGITGIAGAVLPTPAYLTGSTVEHATNEGTIASDINSLNNQLSVTFNGTKVTVNLATATAGTKTLQEVALEIQSRVNNALNNTLGTSNVNYLMVQTSNSTGSNNDFFYFISNCNGSQNSLSVDSNCSAAAALGFGDPAQVTNVAGTDPSGGEHRLTFYDATVFRLNSSAYSGDVSINGTDVMNLSINGITSDVPLTATSAGGTGGVYDWTNETQMAELASNLKSDIDAVFGAGTVTVAWDEAHHKLTLTNSQAGASNTITINSDITGAPSTALLLTSGTGASSIVGTDARVVDDFSPYTGAQSFITMTDTTTAGTASDLTNLLKRINGEALNAGHTAAGGAGPLIAGVALSASDGLTAGTAVINTTRGNELNTALATYATYTGGSGAGSPAINGSKALDKAGFAAAASHATNGTFTINGKAITISDYTMVTVNQVLAMINGSGAGVTASYDGVNNRFVLTSNQKGANQTISVGDENDTSDFLKIAKLSSDEGGSFSDGSDDGKIDLNRSINTSGLSKSVKSGIFSINGVAIYVNAASDTLQDVIQKINNSAAGVTAFYNVANDTLEIISKDDANGRDYITLGGPNDTSNFWWATNMVYPPNEEFDGNDILQTEVVLGAPGRGARLEVDGASYVRRSNNIDDIISGVTLTLHSTSSAQVSLSISSNTEEVLQKMKEFIVAYNTVMEQANQPALTKEQREKQLKELTVAQMNKMTVAQIEEYNKNREALLKQDILHRDTTVRNLHSSLRLISSQIISGLDSGYNSLAALGIHTGTWGNSFNANPHGMLLISSTDEKEIETALRDNTTFMQALEKDPDKIFQLMGQLSQSRVSITGTKDVSSITLDKKLQFTVADWTGNAVIEFEAGVYNSTQIISTINRVLREAGIETIQANLNSSDQLELTAVTPEDAISGQAILNISDQSGGLLASILGIQSGLYQGNPVESLTGIARKIENEAKNYTQSTGLLNLRIKEGGTIDKQLFTVDASIAAFEKRMSMVEQRLWKQFTALEKYMNDMNQKATWLAARLAQLNSATSGNNGF